MADIVKEIEITAALSADYQGAFKAASSIAASSARELASLTKQEAALNDLVKTSADIAKASAAGNDAAVKTLQASYDKLAGKIGLVDKSAAGVAEELKKVGARKKDVEQVLGAAKKQTEFSRVARQIKEYSDATKTIKDPALLRQLDQLKKKFKEMGGAIPPEKKFKFMSTIKDKTKSLPGPIGGLASGFEMIGTKGMMLAGVAGVVGAIGVAAVAAGKKVVGFGMDVIEAGDKIAKTSQQIGINAEAFQELAFAVGLGGASEQELASGLETLSKQMSAAISGNKKAITSFKDLGISLDEVKGMNAEEMFLRVSDSLSTLSDHTEKAKTMAALFGGSSAKLANAIKGGSDALAEMRKEARDAGYVMSNKDLANSEAAMDALTRAQLQFKAISTQIGVEAVPSMTDALNAFTEIIRDNRGDISGFIKDVFSGIREGIALFKRAKAFIEGIPAPVKDVGSAMFSMLNPITAIREGFGGLMTVVEIFTEGIKFWQDQFTGACHAVAGVIDWMTRDGEDSLGGLISYTGDALSKIPGIVGDALSDAYDAAMDWLADTRDGIVSWVQSMLAEIKRIFFSKVDELSTMLSEVPLIGRLFEGGTAAGGVGGVTINVQNSIDARGAAPGAGADIGRAVQASSGPSGESVAAALSSYAGLSYA